MEKIRFAGSSSGNNEGSGGSLDGHEPPSAAIQSIWSLFGTLTNSQRNTLIRGLLERSASSQVEQILKSLNLRASAKFGERHFPVLHGSEEHPKIVAFASKAGALYKKADLGVIRDTLAHNEPGNPNEAPGSANGGPSSSSHSPMGVPAIRNDDSEVRLTSDLLLELFTEKSEAGAGNSGEIDPLRLLERIRASPAPLARQLTGILAERCHSLTRMVQALATTNLNRPSLQRFSERDFLASFMPVLGVRDFALYELPASAEAGHDAPVPVIGSNWVSAGEVPLNALFGSEQVRGGLAVAFTLADPENSLVSPLDLPHYGGHYASPDAIECLCGLAFPVVCAPNLYKRYYLELINKRVSPPLFTAADRLTVGSLLPVLQMFLQQSLLLQTVGRRDAEIGGVLARLPLSASSLNALGERLEAILASLGDWSARVFLLQRTPEGSEDGPPALVRPATGECADADADAIGDAESLGAAIAAGRQRQLRCSIPFAASSSTTPLGLLVLDTADARNYNLQEAKIAAFVDFAGRLIESEAEAGRTRVELLRYRGEFTGLQTLLAQSPATSLVIDGASGTLTWITNAPLVGLRDADAVAAMRDVSYEKWEWLAAANMEVIALVRRLLHAAPADGGGEERRRTLHEYGFILLQDGGGARKQRMQADVTASVLPDRTSVLLTIAFLDADPMTRLGKTLGRYMEPEALGPFLDQQAAAVSTATATAAKASTVIGGKQTLTTVGVSIHSYEEMLQFVTAADMLGVLGEVKNSLDALVGSCGAVPDFGSAQSTLLFHFGLPTASLDDPLRAVRFACSARLALERVSRECKALPFPLKFGVAVATGPAIVGVVGAGKRQVYGPFTDSGVQALLDAARDLELPLVLDSFTREGSGVAGGYHLRETGRVFRGETHAQLARNSYSLPYVAFYQVLSAQHIALDGVAANVNLCYELALTEWKRGNVSGAETSFAKALELDKSMRACACMVRRCQWLNTHAFVLDALLERKEWAGCWNRKWDTDIERDFGGGRVWDPREIERMQFLASQMQQESAEEVEPGEDGEDNDDIEQNDTDTTTDTGVKQDQG